MYIYIYYERILFPNASFENVVDAKYGNMRLQKSWHLDKCSLFLLGVLLVVAALIFEAI